jgi:hypothetical protein
MSTLFLGMMDAGGRFGSHSTFLASRKKTGLEDRQICFQGNDGDERIKIHWIELCTKDPALPSIHPSQKLGLRRRGTYLENKQRAKDCLGFWFSTWVNTHAAGRQTNVSAL